MSNEINFKREVSGSVEGIVEKVTSALKTVGFGVLTRIDLHSKVKEKLGKDLKPVVILGACNPQLAYEAYSLNTDVASLLPCNVVVRETQVDRVSVEIVKPTAMMSALSEPKLVELAREADGILLKVLESI
jgi:uncharacterized protein (DUF302 family)